MSTEDLFVNVNQKEQPTSPHYDSFNKYLNQENGVISTPRNMSSGQGGVAEQSVMRPEMNVMKPQGSSSIFDNTSSLDHSTYPSELPED